MGLSSCVFGQACMECPYGGLCTDGNVVAVPGYWGGVQPASGALSFAVCPTGYCCDGTQRDPCTGPASCRYVTGRTVAQTVCMELTTFFEF